MPVSSLHRLETVYRRLAERLASGDTPEGALRSVIDAWFYALEEDVLAEGDVRESDSAALLSRTSELMEKRLAENRAAPALSAALRGYRQALAQEDGATADALIAWLGAEPNVAAQAKRYAASPGRDPSRDRTAIHPRRGAGSDVPALATMSPRLSFDPQES